MWDRARQHGQGFFPQVSAGGRAGRPPRRSAATRRVGPHVGVDRGDHVGAEPFQRPAESGPGAEQGLLVGPVALLEGCADVVPTPRAGCAGRCDLPTEAGPASRHRFTGQVQVGAAPPGPARIEPELSLTHAVRPPAGAPRRPARAARRSRPRTQELHRSRAGRQVRGHQLLGGRGGSGAGPVHGPGDLPAQRLVITVVIDLAGQLHRDQLTPCAHRRGDLAVLRTLGDPQLGELGPQVVHTGPQPPVLAVHLVEPRPERLVRVPGPPSRPRPPSPGHRQSGEPYRAPRSRGVR